SASSSPAACGMVRRRADAHRPHIGTEPARLRRREPGAPMKRLAIIAVALTVLLGTSPVWKPVAKRHSKWAVVATNVYQDLLRRTGLKTEQIGNPYTPAPGTAEVDRYLSRIDHMFLNYLDRMGISAADPRGKRMLEVGPGDNIGLELRFIAAGAAQAVAVDKF